MSEETSNMGSGGGPAGDGGVPTWSEGPAVDSMTGDQALKEIKSIEIDPSFSGDGKMDYWSRQNMLKRRDALYRRVSGEAGKEPYNGMRETLQKQGITKENLEAENDRLETRDREDLRKKIMNTLTSHFGTEDDAKAAIGDARGIVKRFAKPGDLRFLEESGLGDDAEFIKKLAGLARILNNKRR